MTRVTDVEERDMGVRLAVIESKLEAVLNELSIIRQYIPGKIIEHSERIVVVERNLRSIQWIGGIFAVALVSAFLAHVLK